MSDAAHGHGPATNKGLTGRWQGAMMDNFGTPRIPLVRGEGATVWDADGNEYLDFLGGIAVNSLGHAHPAVVRAVSDQVATLGHVSNFFVASPPWPSRSGCSRWPDAPAGSTSPTPAPRPTRPPSRSAG